MSGNLVPLVELPPSDGQDDDEEKRISNGQQANGREGHSEPDIHFQPEAALDTVNYPSHTQDVHFQPEAAHDTVNFPSNTQGFRVRLESATDPVNFPQTNPNSTGGQEATDSSDAHKRLTLILASKQMEHMGFLPFKDEASSNRFKHRQTSSSKLEVASTQDIGEQKLLKLLCKDFHDRDSWLKEATSVLQIRTQDPDIEAVAVQLKKTVWEKCKPPKGRDLFWILKPNLAALGSRVRDAPGSFNVFSLRALYGAVLHEHTTPERQVANLSVHGVFPIHVAAEDHCLDAVYYLLNWEVDVNQETLYARKTALHHAVRFRAEEDKKKQQKAVISVLTDFKASHTKQDSGGHLPLFNAILTKDEELVEFLIQQHHPNINHADADGDTHLHSAADINCPKIVRLLIEKGADPKVCNKDRQTVCHIAAQKSSACLIAINEACEAKGLELISTFFQEDSSGNTPLDCAALHYQEETFRYIWNCLCKEPSPSAASYRGVLARLSSTAEEDNSFGNLQYALKSIPKSVIQSVMTVDEEEQGSEVASFCSVLKSRKNTSTGVVTTVLDKCLYGEEVVISKVLDSDVNGNYPPKSGYDSVLRQCVDSSDAIWRHPTIRIWINGKWNQFGERIVWIFAFLYFLQMLALTTAFCLAIRPGVTDETLNLYNTPLDQFRGFMEGVVILMCIIKILNELQKFILLRKIYFRDLFVYINFCAIVLMVTTIALRCVQTNIQWAFAALAYLTYSMLALEYFSLMKWSSTYVQTLFIIIKRDLSRFLIVFLVYLVGFSGAFLLVLQVDRPYTSRIVQDGGGSSEDHSDNNSTLYIWNTFYLGLRIMIEGGSVIDYNGRLGWLAVLFYVGFLTVTVLMMLNVLIAQMSDTYTRVRCNAKALATFHRARFMLRYLCMYEKWWPKPNNYWEQKVIIWRGKSMSSANTDMMQHLCKPCRVVKEFFKSVFLADEIALRRSDDVKKENVTTTDMEVMMGKMKKSLKNDLKVLRHNESTSMTVILEKLNSMQSDLNALRPRATTPTTSDGDGSLRRAHMTRSSRV